VPTVSVVIPWHRGGPYLREAIASIQAQTLDDWEVNIVSDGCDEDLSDPVEADRRLRLFTQRRRGQAVVRNVGIGHTRSDLVAFLDEDDRMLPDRLLAQVEAMRHPSVGLCHSQIQVIDTHGAVTRMGRSRETQYGDLALLADAPHSVSRPWKQPVGWVFYIFRRRDQNDLVATSIGGSGGWRVSQSARHPPGQKICAAEPGPVCNDAKQRGSLTSRVRPRNHLPR
jgi:glycosyltransferase involved in cell wall biosynthesis